MDATQTEVPAGALQSLQQGGWNGMSIKEILEKVDLFNITNLVGDDDQKLKEAKASLLMPNIKVKCSRWIYILICFFHFDNLFVVLKFIQQLCLEIAGRTHQD